MQDETSNKNQSEDWSLIIQLWFFGSACLLMFGFFTYLINWSRGIQRICLKLIKEKAKAHTTCNQLDYERIEF